MTKQTTTKIKTNDELVLMSIPLTGKNPPPGWHLTQPGQDGGMWDNHRKLLRVVASIGKELDGHQWLHISVSHRRRVPTYDEICYVKRHWAGDDRKCVMVFPAKSEHVNIHPYCLHLWCCVDGDPLPDFTHGLGTI